jgi:NAD(P)-dependent dehydrogenase (short-subunit alcohol dehydrogenase family)
VYGLASRGAQVILLTQHAPSDLFLVDYIEDLRRSTGNQLIHAEQVDLSSLHSIRKFATKWVDNAPPRRLDTIILCANTLTPSQSRRRWTVDGLDEEWQVNYLSNFHLLSILSPALRAQPPDRDVRVIFGTCPSYIGATIDLNQIESVNLDPLAKTKVTKSIKGQMETSHRLEKQRRAKIHGMTKLATMVFAQAFQKHLSSYKRPDTHPVNARVLIVDPGFCRTPGMRRWLTGGSLWGLLAYLITWPLWWLILKSPRQGSQSFLYAAMDAQFGRGGGGWMIKECREVDLLQKDVRDENMARSLWEFSEQQIQTKEKETAVKRAAAKKEKEQEADEKNNKQTTTAETRAQTPGSRRGRKIKTNG